MSKSNQSVVVTRKVTKIFRDFWLREKVTAVTDLDMAVEPGEVFGLLGPNGSGKSTTLKMVLGLLFPTRGHIAVFGRRPTDVRTKARIGFLPEESYLYPFLDARETLEFYGKLFHLPRGERHRRIDMLLEMVGLSAVAYRRIGEYSKGMQRRIGLAQALINDPDLLILDEPTSGMDPIGTRQIKDIITTLADRGKTIILSSHLLADVEDVCSRLCVLYGGQRQAEGDIDQLLARREQTQLIADRLDDETIRQVRQLIEQAGKRLVNVTFPHEKLETLFLRVVEEARKKKVKTGGAISGGAVAEFLRQVPEGQQLIETLVSAGKAEREPEPVVESVEPVPVEQQPVEDVLEELVEPQKKPPVFAEPPSAPKEPSSSPRDMSQADRSVIDDLLKKNDEGEES